MNFEEFLLSIGVKVCAQLIIDTLNQAFGDKKSIDKKKIRRYLKELNIQEVQMDSIINFFAENGTIEINGADISAKNISYISSLNSNIDLKDTVSKTTNSSLKIIGKTSFVKLKGKASIEQKN